MVPSSSLSRFLLLTVGWIILVSLQSCWVAAAKCFCSQVLEVSSNSPVMCPASPALTLNRPCLSCPCCWPVFLEIYLLTCGFEMLFTWLVSTLLFLSILEALEFVWGLCSGIGFLFKSLLICEGFPV